MPHHSPICAPAQTRRGGIFDFDAKANRLNEVNDALEDPKVWDDAKRAQELGREKKALEDVVTTLTKLDTNSVDAQYVNTTGDTMTGKLNLPSGTSARFDGVFANAALFHVPSADLPRVLKELHACLKPGGVLFSSNPRGANEEGWNKGRYGVYHDLEAWRRYLGAAGFAELDHYYRPEGLPREQQAWLASVWRRR